MLDRIGDAGCVLLGEPTHGTSEFYAARAHITQRPIEEKGFNAVAVEADWPDAYRAGCWAHDAGDHPDASAPLGDFTRFPRWMWRNHEFSSSWSGCASTTPEPADVGFYGLDLYSMHASIDKVLDYLDKVDPAASARARARYGCFDHYGQHTSEYGRSAAFGAGPTCETEVVEQLVELQRRAGEQAHPGNGGRRPTRTSSPSRTPASCATRSVATAMFRVGAESWNLRDTHMAETLDALRTHLARNGRPGTRRRDRGAPAPHWDDEPPDRHG